MTIQQQVIFLLLSQQYSATPCCQYAIDKNEPIWNMLETMIVEWMEKNPEVGAGQEQAIAEGVLDIIETSYL